jgi:hypothetical protein
VERVAAIGMVVPRLDGEQHAGCGEGEENELPESSRTYDGNQAMTAGKPRTICII